MYKSVPEDRHTCLPPSPAKENLLDHTRHDQSWAGAVRTVAVRAGFTRQRLLQVARLSFLSPNQLCQSTAAHNDHRLSYDG